MEYAASTPPTSPHKCGLYGVACNKAETGCLALDILKGQAEIGGTGAGPKMAPEVWYDFVQRTEEVASMGCLELGQLALAAHDLSALKRERGDFGESEVPAPVVGSPLHRQ